LILLELYVFLLGGLVQSALRLLQVLPRSLQRIVDTIVARHVEIAKKNFTTPVFMDERKNKEIDNSDNIINDSNGKEDNEI